MCGKSRSAAPDTITHRGAAESREQVRHQHACVAPAAGGGIAAASEDPGMVGRTVSTDAGGAESRPAMNHNFRR
jgi:hypothetical protein